MKRNYVKRVVRLRHVVHLTRFTHERERMGKSPYVTRTVNFRHAEAM